MLSETFLSRTAVVVSNIINFPNDWNHWSSLSVSLLKDCQRTVFPPLMEKEVEQYVHDGASWKYNIILDALTLRSTAVVQWLFVDGLEKPHLDI